MVKAKVLFRIHTRGNVKQIVQHRAAICCVDAKHTSCSLRCPLECQVCLVNSPGDLVGQEGLTLSSQQPCCPAQLQVESPCGWALSEPSWPGSLTALGFLYPADCLHRAVMESALCLKFIPQITKVTTQLLSLLDWYKSITELFASWGQKSFITLVQHP